eukprot:TRINITY_DN5948_c0_g2_i1.p1 TRINITY_DN5948_c0_g2~~TRINITY_DN5948_c0_g2_i1.p1  ORF type:complete len:474 (+),score=73.04 TRINITY_DN5948_c0_g2_i1:128-1423(+)
MVVSGALLSLLLLAASQSEYVIQSIIPNSFSLAGGNADILLNATRLTLEKLDALASEVEELKTQLNGQEDIKHKMQELIDRADQVAKSSQGGLSLDDLTLVRQGHRSPRGMCGYSEGELEGVLSLSHSCKRGEKRYFYNGVWLDFPWLSSELADLRAAQDPIVCVLVCNQQPPCDKIPCILPVYLRRNTTDTMVARQLLEGGDYDLLLKPSFQFNTILDAGSNTGIAAALFATVFPKAQIVCIEASHRNFDMLRLNTANYPNVIAINAALWPRVASLALVKGNRNPDLPPEWGFMVTETHTVAEGAAVEASILGVSVSFILKLLGIPSFDLVKIDIEGSEKEVFTKSKQNKAESWVRRAKLVVVEIHPDMRPGSDEVVHSFFTTLHAWAKVPDWSGEYEVYRNTHATLEGERDSASVVTRLLIDAHNDLGS